MFTNNRTKLRHAAYVTKEVGSGTSVVLTILGLFLGPVGWLLTLFAEDSKEVKTVKKKLRFHISQCVLCVEESVPEVLDFDNKRQKFQVNVHDRFAVQLTELQERANEEES